MANYNVMYDGDRTKVFGFYSATEPAAFSQPRPLTDGWESLFVDIQVFGMPTRVELKKDLFTRWQNFLTEKDEWYVTAGEVYFFSRDLHHLMEKTVFGDFLFTTGDVHGCLTGHKLTEILIYWDFMQC